MPDALEPAVIACPSCGATLRNVIVAARKVACLNCGAKFMPPEAGGGAVENVSTVAEVTTVAREPQAAGYWMLRGMAAISLAVGLVYFGLMVCALLYELFVGGRFGYQWENSLLLIGWGGLLALLGILTLLATGALGRIEAAALHAGWRMGRIRQTLPAVPGSALPYLAPFLVLGGVLFIVSAQSMQQNRMFESAGGLFMLVPLAIIPAIGTALAMAMVELQQFFWRQRQLALALAAEGQALNLYPLDGILPGILAMPVSLFAAVLAVIIGYLFASNHNNYNDNTTPMKVAFLVAAFFLCHSLTILLLGRSFGIAVRLWGQRAHTFCKPLVRDGARGIAIRTAVLLALLVAIANAMMLWQYVEMFRQSMRQVLYEQALIMGALFALAMSAILFTCVVYLELHAWRLMQQKFWERELQVAAVRLPSFEAAVLALSRILCVVLVVAVAVEIPWTRPDLPEVIELMVLMCGWLYAGFWMLAVFREILLAKALGDAVRARVEALHGT